MAMRTTRTLYDLGDAFNGVMDMALDETMDLSVCSRLRQISLSNVREVSD